jgi:hypothetical protein
MESIGSTDAQNIRQITQSLELLEAEGGAVFVVKITHCEICEKLYKEGEGES